MAISEHDRQLLQELEEDFLAADPRSSPAPVWRRVAGILVASSGLVTGLLVVFAGLRLASAIGTLVGVAGSLILIASAWLFVGSVRPWLRSRMTSRRDDWSAA